MNCLDEKGKIYKSYVIKFNKIESVFKFKTKFKKSEIKFTKDIESWQQIFNNFIYREQAKNQISIDERKKNNLGLNR
jgi:hypothetical protein